MHITNFEVGNYTRLFLIAGNCVIENESIAMDTAGQLHEICTDLNIPLIYKSSFDKANRTSSKSFRGIGIDKGLQILQKIKQTYNIPVLTDVHEYTPLNEVADVVDVLQTPSLLARQTDFIQAVANEGLPMNIKKGQFMAPSDMIHVVMKAKETGNQNIMVCERGYVFGYNDLISDPRSLVDLRHTGCPVIYDASHSIQTPGSEADCSGGDRTYIKPLARAAVANGVAGIFIETHPDPDNALCDGPNSYRLDSIKKLLIELQQIDNIIKQL